MCIRVMDYVWIRTGFAILTECRMNNWAWCTTAWILIFSRFARVAIGTLSYSVFAWSDSKSRHHLRGWTRIDWQNRSCAYACSGAWCTLNSSKRLNGEDSYLAAAWSTRSVRQHVVLRGHPQVSALHNNQAERPWDVEALEDCHFHKISCKSLLLLQQRELKQSISMWRRCMKDWARPEGSTPQLHQFQMPLCRNWQSRQP